MSTTITLPKNTPIVTFCGVASRFMHSIKLTFIDDGKVVKVRKWYGNDRWGRIIGADDLFFEGDDVGSVTAKVKIMITKDRGESWLEMPYEETGDYTDLHLIKRISVRERGDDHSDASVSFNYYLNI